MLKLYRLTPLILIFFTATAQADNASSELAPDSALYFKQIMKGDSELSIDLGVNYDSFWGVEFNRSLAYRYFFFDKVAFGLIYQRMAHQYSKRTRLGVSGRWYFAETKNWAFSYTGNLMFQRTENDLPGVYSGVHDSLIYQHSLAAHYFINDHFSIGPSLYHEIKRPMSHNSFSHDYGLLFNLGFHF